MSIKMSCNNLILAVICVLCVIHQIQSVSGQAIACNPIYAIKPNATCWREFPSTEVDECSHKFCYGLNEGTTKCTYPWRKPTIHREHELERLATLARNQFATQQSCTMKLKVNKQSKSSLLFFQHEYDCIGLETFTLSPNSCAVVHLNRALHGYCIWYHNDCPKVPTDITVCKRDKDIALPTQSPRQGITVADEDEEKSSLSTEIIVIVAVSANFVVLLIVALLVSFLLKRSRISNRRHDTLTRNPSNRPLPSVPNEFGKRNHRMSKADSAEFDKWKDESHYMYLSHESLNAPRYHSITRKEVGSDYSYPDMEQVRQTLERRSDKSSYMALMKDGKNKPTKNENNELSEKMTISETIDNGTKRCINIIEDTSTAQTQSAATCADDDDMDNRHRKSFAYSDADGDYSELKPDYYVLEENAENGTESNVENTVHKDDRVQGTTCTQVEQLACAEGKALDTDREELKCAEKDGPTGVEEEQSCHDYFQLEKDDSETAKLPMTTEEENGQRSIRNEQVSGEPKISTSQEHSNCS